MALFVLKSRYDSDLEVHQRLIDQLQEQVNEFNRTQRANTTLIGGLKEDLKLRTAERDKALTDLSNTQRDLAVVHGKLTEEEVSHSRTHAKMVTEKYSNESLSKAIHIWMEQFGDYLRQKSQKMNPKRRAAFEEDFQNNRRAFEQAVATYGTDVSALESVNPDRTSEPIAADRGQSF